MHYALQCFYVLQIVLQVLWQYIWVTYCQSFGASFDMFYSLLHQFFVLIELEFRLSTSKMMFVIRLLQNGIVDNKKND